MFSRKKNAEVVSDQPRYGDDHRNLSEGPIAGQGLAGEREKNLRIDNNIPDNLSVAETDMSFGAIMKGTAVAPLTVFERKAALINA